MTCPRPLPSTWDSHHTLFQSVLPIMSNAGLQLVLVWVCFSSSELKNGFSFFISTRYTEQEFSLILWLGSSAPGPNCKKWRISFVSQKGVRALSRIKPFSLYSHCRESSPTLSFPAAQLRPSFVSLWTLCFLVFNFLFLPTLVLLWW